MTALSPNSLPLLAISTSAPTWSLALSTPDRHVAHVTLQSPRGKSRDLIGAIDHLLGDAGLTVADLGGLAVDVGPGSFTSLRMGLATVRALGWAAGLPIAPVTSLAVLLAEARSVRAGPAVCAIVARRGWWYVGECPAATAPQDCTSAVVDDAGLAAWLAQWRSPATASALVTAGALPDAVTGDAPDARWVSALARSLPAEAWTDARAVIPAYLAASEAEVAAGFVVPDRAQPAESQPI